MNRWPLHKAYFWETAPFFRILLPFAAGILCYYNGWVVMPGTLALAVICVAAVLFGALAITRRSDDVSTISRFVLLCIVLFSFGSGEAYYSDVHNNSQWFGHSVNKESSYLVRITDAPAEKESTWKVPVRMISSIKDGSVNAACGDAFIYLYKDRFPMLLHRGDSILVPDKWQPVKNAGNPFEFDYAAYCKLNGIDYLQYCSVNDVRLYGVNDPAAASFITRCHDYCMEQLDKYLPDSKTRGLVQAMLLGDEVNLDEDLRQSYADTGIIHIIAISGGNVAILFFVISALLWWLRHKQHLWVKYLIALPLVWLYVLMAGAAPSAIRAAIMFSLLAFAVLFQKNNNSLNQLFATGFLLLCAQPAWLFSTGFQLSFVAVLSLILFYKRIFKWWSPVNKIGRELWSVVAASIAAEVLVAPLVIYYFHTFPLLFVIANAAAYLFMSIVLVLGIAIIVLGFIAPVAAFIGTCTIWFVTVFDNIVTHLQNFNPVSFHFLLLSGPQLFILYFIIGGFALFLIQQHKGALFTGLAASCILMCLLCRAEWVCLHQQRLVIYNTGKAGCAELINGRTYTTLMADTAAQKKTAYTTKPAHINWQAWRESKAPATEIISIHGKTVLLACCNIDTAARFHVAYLFVNNEDVTDPLLLQKVFSPDLIIIGNNYGRKQKEQFVKACAVAAIPAHAIAEGAFVLE